MTTSKSELAQTLDQTAAFLRRYVLFANPEQAIVAALWVGHTWV